MSTILLISPEPWEGHAVSKHHYARELARRGHVVLFHGPPEAKGALRLVPVRDVPGGRGDLRLLLAPRVAPALRFLPAPLRRALEARWLAQVEATLGQRIDVVWNFENSRFFDMSFAGKRLKIYQQVDLDQDFHPQRAAATADVAIALDAPIRDRLLMLNVKKTVHLVSHGLFVPEATEYPTPVIDLPKDRVNAAYVGNLGIKDLDIDAFSRVVRQHEGRVLFHLFGKFDETTPLRRALINQDNVIWHGWTDPRIIDGYLSKFDVTMVIYRADSNVEQLSNSHKVLEYLHSGAVVVSSFMLDYMNRPDLIEMAPLGGSYSDLFASVLERLERLNAPERRQMRKAYAIEHTYSKKLDQIEALIETHRPDAALRVRR